MSILKMISTFIRVLKDRWLSKSPKIFRKITNIGCSISAIALSVNLSLVASGAVTPTWWVNLFPYLVGVPAGMAAIAKLTKEDQNGQ